MDGKKPGETLQIKRKRVLVVDDDTKILRFVGMSLSLAGYEVITAAGGEEALKIVQTNHPDIMLLDILMPGVDGLEVLQRLRQTSKVPVIAFSAHATAADEARRLGANDFLAKPFRPDELTGRIEAVLNKC